jgi:hypothetical protein
MGPRCALGILQGRPFLGRSASGRDFGCFTRHRSPSSPRDSLRHYLSLVTCYSSLSFSLELSALSCRETARKHPLLPAQNPDLLRRAFLFAMRSALCPMPSQFAGLSTSMARGGMTRLREQGCPCRGTGSASIPPPRPTFEPP